MVEQVDNIINKMTGSVVGTDNQDTSENSKNNGQMFFCDATTQDCLNDFVGQEKPKLVALVGFADYGKSTFIGSLYQMLIERYEYNGYSLVDSETYTGFERRVFLRRVNNEDTSDTKRNVLGESDILHFKLQSIKGITHEILISDKAGETYSKYISSEEEIKKDIVIAKADLLVFFIDAEKDSQSLAEHNLIVEKYVSLLERLKARKKLVSKTPYILVFTKVDKVLSEDSKKKLVERQKVLCALFSDNIGVSPKYIYKVNSKSQDNEQLNQAFAWIMSKRTIKECTLNLDWAKKEIEEQ
jgi:GTP-binding protein EngB required for normal cell division